MTELRRPFRTVAFWLLLIFAFAPAGVSAPGESQRPPLKDWQKLLDDTEKELEQPEISDSRLVALRDQLTALSERVRAAAGASAREAEVLRSDLAALGPAPAAEAPPEAPSIAAQRKSLTAELAAAEGVGKAADLLNARVDRLMDTLKALRRTRFTERVLSRSVSPVSPSIWTKALPEAAAAWQRVQGTLGENLTWSAISADARAVGGRLAVGMILAMILAFPLRSRLIRRFGYITVAGEPTYAQRLWAASFTGIVGSLLPSLAAVAIYCSLAYDQDLADPIIDLARLALVMAVGIFFVAGFCRSALAPDDPDWRLAPIGDFAARAVSRAVTGLAVLFALDRLLRQAAAQYDVSVELIYVQKFAIGLSISAVLMTLLRRRIWVAGREATITRNGRRLRFLLAILVAAIPLSAVFGYVVLSRLLATQLVLTVGLVALTTLLRRIAAEAVDHALSQDSEIGQKLRSVLALSDDGAEMLGFWGGGFLQVAIVLAGGAGLLLLWGVAGKDLSAWLVQVFLGFKVGRIEISLAQVLLALLLFVALLAATRVIQKTLDQRIFPKTRLDAGVRQSIRATVGYAGFTVAAIVAVSAVGFGLSNVAIVAGALSVGVGLGLQNIVNNFVSGLILLVERPIKVGDWVVVGEHQGYVRKISVRSTEIKTFDRASVFVPNSNLISGVVMNRTYAEKVGRIILPVGVAYDADPQQARDLLLEIARGHPEVRKNPAPSVLFRSFGDHSLNLELIAFVGDVEKTLGITSDLCFSVFEAFHKAGIQIPFPQRDLRVTLDEAQLARLLDRGRSDENRPLDRQDAPESRGGRLSRESCTETGLQGTQSGAPDRPMAP